jgi:hypothetical protein
LPLAVRRERDGLKTKPLDILTNIRYLEGMSKHKQSKMGRPKFPPGVARSVYVAFRLSPSERERMEAAAAKQGLTMAAFLRDAVLVAVDEVEGKQ